MNNEYKKIQKKALYLTILSNILFFLLLMIIVAWKETYPPPEEYGIELGSETSENSELSEFFEEANDNTQIERSETDNFEEEMDLEKEENIELNPNQSVENEESLDEKFVENDEVLNNSNENISEDKNQSESINKVADSSLLDNYEKTNKIIDERAIYNTNKITGSKGSSLEMQGWIWDFEPNPDDNSRESGKIVFEIIVDYYGEIEGLKILETTLSPKVENIYKEEILKLTFSPTNNNNPAEISKGKITFIIKNN